MSPIPRHNSAVKLSFIVSPSGLGSGPKAGQQLLPEARVDRLPLANRAVQLDGESQGARVDDEPAIDELVRRCRVVVGEFPVGGVVAAVPDMADRYPMVRGI